MSAHAKPKWNRYKSKENIFLVFPTFQNSVSRRPELIKMHGYLLGMAKKPHDILPCSNSIQQIPIFGMCRGAVGVSIEDLMNGKFYEILTEKFIGEY